MFLIHISLLQNVWAKFITTAAGEWVKLFGSQ